MHVAHYNCFGRIPVDFFDCSAYGYNIDISFRFACPDVREKAILFEKETIVNHAFGANAVTFGYQSHHKRGYGYVAQLVSLSDEPYECVKSFADCPRIPRDSFIFKGDNNLGGSGSPIISSEGIVAIVSSTEKHAEVKNLLIGKFYATRAKLALNCLEKIIEKEKIDENFKNCENLYGGVVPPNWSSLE
jgi:hypothetical protein